MRLESPVFAEEVTYLINFCILNRSLPSGSKTASLLSLNGGLTDKANYRPVSISGSFSNDDGDSSENVTKASKRFD